MKYSFILLILPLLFFSACEKESEKFSEIPLIEFKSISPQQATAYSDSVRIEIFYRDGDGDLGENNNEVKNCFVTDSRNGVTYEYRIQQLAPDNAMIAIQGTFHIYLKSVPMMDNLATSEQVTYSIYVTDRAGNQSNTVTTSVITVSQ